VEIKMRFKVGISLAALIIGSSALLAVEASAQGRHQGPGGAGPGMSAGRSAMSGAPAGGRSFGGAAPAGRSFGGASPGGRSFGGAPAGQSFGSASPAGRSFGSASPSVQTGNGAFAGRSYAGRSFRHDHDRGGRGWIGPAAGFVAGAAATGAYYGGDNGYYDNGYQDNGYAAYGYDDDAAPVYGAPIYGAPAYAGDDGVSYCVARFRSYDPASGTYLGNDGLRHSCP
jgi:hypothetical protein